MEGRRCVWVVKRAVVDEVHGSDRENCHALSDLFHLSPSGHMHYSWLFSSLCSVRKERSHVLGIALSSP